MSKKVKKIVGMAAPLAGLIPGIGLPLAIGLGAGGGLLSGGGLKGALAGGLGAAAFGGGGSLLGGALGGAGTALGGVEGLGLATQSALGTGLLGAGAGAASGGLKGAAIGGALGGLGGYYSGGGFDGLGESLGLTGDSGILTKAGAALGMGSDTLGSGSLTAADTNFLNKAGVTAGTLADAGAGTAGGGMSSYGKLGAAGTLLSGFSGMKANDDAEKALLAAQGKSLDAIQPYLNAKFTPGDLTQDPGYQFRLQQGQQALDRSAGAKGSLFSGSQIKAGQDYGQGLADSTYNDAYQRFLAQNQQNIGAAGMASNVFDNQGNIQAGAGVNNSNVLNKTISGLFGNGAFGNSGQNLMSGSLTPEQIAMLLAQSKSASIYG